MYKPIKFLENHCEFKSPYDCYVLLAVSRKKDTPEITNSQEIVFRKIIKKKEDIIRKYNVIKAECSDYRDENDKSFPFYIYVSLNARDSYKATHILMNQILNWMYEEKKGSDRSRMFKRVDGYFYSVLMKKESRTTVGQKYFMIDFDMKGIKYYNFISELKKLSIPIVLIQETRNGYHIKTLPFDRRKLKDLKNKYDFEVKTDANIFLEYVRTNDNTK